MIILKGNETLTREQFEALIDKIKAIIYARVSSEDQIKNYSLDSQIEMCLEKSKKDLNCNEDEVIALMELGVSGDNSERPAFNYALKLLEDSLCQKIIVLHPNRLARDLELQLYYTRRIWESGCEIHFVESEVDKDNPESMLLFNLQGSIAQYNKAKILADSKRGRRQKAKSGKISGMNRLYGYTFDKENDIAVVNEYEKSVYLSMVDMLLNKDMTCSEIALQLSKDNIPAPNGNVWYQSTISRMLKNESYTGKYYYGKTEVVQVKGKRKQVPKPREEWILIPIPRYISDITFKEIEKKLKENTKRKSGRTSEDYLLKGKVRCGRCGSAVTSGITTKTKTRLLKYYTCIRKSKKGYVVGTSDVSHEICLGRNWRVDIVDNFVWEELIRIIHNPVEIISQILSDDNREKKIAEYSKNKMEIEKKIEVKNKSIERYIDLYASEIIKTKRDLESKISSADEEIKQLKNDLILIKNSIEILSGEISKEEKIKETLSQFNNLIKDPEKILISQKKELVDILVRKVTLHDDGKIDVELNIPFPAHKNSNDSQGDGMDFYVRYDKQLPKGTWGGDGFVSKHELIEHRLNELIKMYHDELKTFEEISEETGIKWWTIKELFKRNNVPRISLSERARLRRKKDFAIFYNLHINQKLTLKEIGERFKKSSPYVSQVLSENGIAPINYGKYN